MFEKQSLCPGLKELNSVSIARITKKVKLANAGKRVFQKFFFNKHLLIKIFAPYGFLSNEVINGKATDSAYSVNNLCKYLLCSRPTTYCAFDTHYIRET